MTNEAGALVARVTHLEMHDRPAHRVPMPSGHRIAVMATHEMPLHFYRYLYEQVGKPHHWLLRRHLDDAELSERIHAPTSSIEVLYCDGVPAGFFELDLTRLPDEAEILYFGLIKEFQGRGLSKFFLSCAIYSAWDREPEKLTIQTNTLDSPRALRLYQMAGFEPAAWSEETVEPWA